jgi:hypothetical protein
VTHVPGKAISYSYLPTLFIHKKKGKEEKKNLHSFFFIYSEIKYVYVLVSLHIRKAKEEMNNAIAK